MIDQDVRDRARKLDLLELRKHLDGERVWQCEIAGLESTIADPDRAGEHERSKKLLALARRALALSKEQTARCMRILNLRDDNEEIERQLAALDE